MTIFDGTLTQVAPTPAVATATINIGQIDIITGGTGYSTDPLNPVVVTITDATNPDPLQPDKGASALATVAAGGSVSSILITNPGAGYLTPGIRKFVDTLPNLTPAGANSLGNYIPVAQPDTTTYPGADYYEIALVQYRQKFHSDLPETLLRGYVQLSTDVTKTFTDALSNPTDLQVPLTNDNLDDNVLPSPALLPDGTQAVGVDQPRYLGPTIVATKDKPVRILFRNLLPTSTVATPMPETCSCQSTPRSWVRA